MVPPRRTAAAADDAPKKGSWAGSTVTLSELRYYRRRGYFGPMTTVAVTAIQRTAATVVPENIRTVLRAPPEFENVPHPGPNERVFFCSHLDRGLAPWVSAFITTFLAFFGLQIHHLGPNAMTYLAYFASLCENYLGV